ESCCFRLLAILQRVPRPQVAQTEYRREVLRRLGLERRSDSSHSLHFWLLEPTITHVCECLPDESSQKERPQGLVSDDEAVTASVGVFPGRFRMSHVAKLPSGELAVRLVDFVQKFALLG